MKKPEINTRKGKRTFLRNYLKAVRDHLLSRVPYMPDEWDGVELRWLVSDQFSHEQMHRFDKEYLRRVRDYNRQGWHV